MTQDFKPLPELQLSNSSAALPVTEAERKVLACVITGKFAKISTGLDVTSPEPWTNNHTIRAKFLRHLCLHPDLHKIDPCGVQIYGAFIKGELNLQFATLTMPIAIIHSRFSSAPNFQHCTVPGLNLNASFLPGLNADGLTCTGGLFLKGVTATGEVRLLGAQIGGNLACNDANLTTDTDKAFFADSLTCKGNVFLNNVTATGQVRLLGADIGGNLECDDANLTTVTDKAFSADGLTCKGCVILKNVTATGEVRLLGAKIGGDLVCNDGKFSNKDETAFNAQRLRVHGRLFWRDFSTAPVGHIDFTHAQVGDFYDDGSGWPETVDHGLLVVDGFTYDNLGLPTSAHQRIEWLNRMPVSETDFLPQPYEQLIAVFRQSGHDHEARKIAIEKQEAYRRLLGRKISKLREDCFSDKKPPPSFGFISNRFIEHRLWLWFFKITAGFGYRPLYTLYWLLLMVGLGAGIFHFAHQFEYMHVAKERVYMDESYVASHTLPVEYPEFNALVFSIDTLIPFVDLHQETYWEPASDGWVGGGFRFYLWLHIIAGWVFTTVAVAGFTGLIKKD